MDDAVQEVFLVIHEKLHTVGKPESLRSWIYGITRRVAAKHRRREKRGELSPDDSAANLPSLSPTPLELTERAAEVALMQEILGELTEPKREVFLLVELEEMPVPEVAEALNIPLNTAYSRLRHARLEFDSALSRRLDKGHPKGLP